MKTIIIACVFIILSYLAIEMQNYLDRRHGI